jgi:DNA repair exonuclease SbcCD nuclease subunit
VPVFLLPGNHDPLDAASVFTSATFKAKVPPNVTVLHDCSPRELRPGVEVVGAPWSSKRPLEDLAAGAVAGLAPSAGVQRVLVAHGAVDTLSPNADDPALIRVASAEQALARGVVHYVALGDRHSTTPVGVSGRIWYSGSPVATDFDETDPNQALVVELTDTAATVTEHVSHAILPMTPT